MPEPISLAASFLALGAGAVKIYLIFAEFQSAFKHAPQEIRLLSEEMTQVVALINRLQEAVEDGTVSERVREELRPTAMSIHGLFQQLEELLEKKWKRAAVDSKIGMWETTKWVVDRREVVWLGEELAKCKATMVAILQADQVIMSHRVHNALAAQAIILEKIQQATQQRQAEEAGTRFASSIDKPEDTDRMRLFLEDLHKADYPAPPESVCDFAEEQTNPVPAAATGTSGGLRTNWDGMSTTSLATATDYGEDNGDWVPANAVLGSGGGGLGTLYPMGSSNPTPAGRHIDPRREKPSLWKKLTNASSSSNTTTSSTSAVQFTPTSSNLGTSLVAERNPGNSLSPQISQNSLVSAYSVVRREPSVEYRRGKLGPTSSASTIFTNFTNGSSITTATSVSGGPAGSCISLAQTFAGEVGTQLQEGYITPAGLPQPRTLPELRAHLEEQKRAHKAAKRQLALDIKAKTRQLNEEAAAAKLQYKAAEVQLKAQQVEAKRLAELEKLEDQQRKLRLKRFASTNGAVPAAGKEGKELPGRSQSDRIGGWRAAGGGLGIFAPSPQQVATAYALPPSPIDPVGWHTRGEIYLNDGGRSELTEDEIMRLQIQEIDLACQKYGNGNPTITRTISTPPPALPPFPPTYETAIATSNHKYLAPLGNDDGDVTDDEDDDFLKLQFQILGELEAEEKRLQELEAGKGKGKAPDAGSNNQQHYNMRGSKFKFSEEGYNRFMSDMTQEDSSQPLKRFGVYTAQDDEYIFTSPTTTTTTGATAGASRFMTYTPPTPAPQIPEKIPLKDDILTHGKLDYSLPTIANSHKPSPVTSKTSPTLLNESTLSQTTSSTSTKPPTPRHATYPQPSAQQLFQIPPPSSSAPTTPSSIPNPRAGRLKPKQLSHWQRKEAAERAEKMLHKRAGSHVDDLIRDASNPNGKSAIHGMERMLNTAPNSPVAASGAAGGSVSDKWGVADKTGNEKNEEQKGDVEGSATTYTPLMPSEETKNIMREMRRQERLRLMAEKKKENGEGRDEGDITRKEEALKGKWQDDVGEEEVKHPAEPLRPSAETVAVMKELRRKQKAVEAADLASALAAVAAMEQAESQALPPPQPTKSTDFASLEEGDKPRPELEAIPSGHEQLNPRTLKPKEETSVALEGNGRPDSTFFPPTYKAQYQPQPQSTNPVEEEALINFSDEESPIPNPTTHDIDDLKGLEFEVSKGVGKGGDVVMDVEEVEEHDSEEEEEEHNSTPAGRMYSYSDVDVDMHGGAFWLY